MNTHAPARRRHWLSLIGVLAMVMALVPFAAAPAAAQTDAPAQDQPAQDQGDALNLSGATNVEYAIAWSQVTYTPLTTDAPDNAPSEALLGRDDLFADNLASGALQGTAAEDGNGAPLLLTDSTDLDDATLAELDRLSGRANDDTADDADFTVRILGGTDAISQSVEDELTDAGYTVERLAGETRIETAIEIAATQDSDTVLVVRAFPSADSTDATQAFADALGAGALAATNGWEILFTQSDVLTGNTADALAAQGYTQAYVVGGVDAISEDVFQSIDDIVATTDRVEGDTRFDTAIALNELREGTLGDTALIVDGQAADAWADGFPAANLSGLNNYPLVLSNQGMIPAPTEAYLADFGGTTAQSFAAHFTDVVLVCGATVDEATCQEALDIINGGEGGEVRPFPPVDEEPTVQSFTDAPELIAVAMEDSTGEEAQLRFTFDEQITGGTPVAECFHLYAFDLAPFAGGDAAADCTAAGGGHEGDPNANPASVDGTVAEIAADDTSAVLVTFPITEQELASVTLATVDWAAVLDDDGIQNLEGDIPLEATLTGGITDAPDLVEIREFNAETDTVEFVFDEPVAEVIENPMGFVLIDAQGNTLVSDAAERSTADGEDNVVVATFNSDANDEGAAGPGIEPTTEGDIVRAGVTSGSVLEDGGEATNPLQVVEVALDGLTEGDPDLVSITVDREADTVVYRFDVPVNVAGGECAQASDPITGQPLPDPTGITVEPAACFQVYDRRGVEIDAVTAERGATNTDVIATFPEGVLDEALGASVEEDAVSAVQGTENPGNEIDELPIEDIAIEAGATAGPDLISVAVVSTDALGTQTVVEYTFDEEVATVEPDPVAGVGASPDATRFFIYDAAGNPTRGETAQVDPDDPNVVQVVFDENEQVIADAVTGTVNDLAVVDEEGDANPEGAGGALLR